LEHENVTFADHNRGRAPIEQLLRQGAQALAEAGVENPRREARLLLQHALGLSAEQMLALSPRNAVEPAGYLDAVARRARHEPFAYITGQKGFWTLDLAVSPASLVPRGDTETLVSCVLDLVPDREAPLSVLDLGTGTGCVLLAVLSEYPSAWGVGVDINPQAAALAAGNATRCGLAGRAAFMAGSWTEALEPGARFDLVLSNPPYIPSHDLSELMPEVRDHEPVRALDGGADGLDAYRQLCADLPARLTPEGFGVFEIGIGQEADLRGLAAENHLNVIEVRADFQGISRAVVMQRQSA
jgi:release factor glutamine methyltransferase